MPELNPFAQNLPQEVALPYLQPNYSEIQSIAQRANSLFETNLNQVKNDYSSVLNAPVTNAENQEKKQEYGNNFRTGLKRVASGDLSMPQNVLQAENLLQPFWNDSEMMQDIAGTKYAQDNIQKVQAGLLSKDDKERDTFSIVQIQDQQDYLDELRTAHRGDGSIGRVQRRTISPFINITKTLNDAAKDQKLEIKYASGTGTPYLISTTGGTQTIPNYETWARGQLQGNKDAEGMFQTIGRVAANRAKREVMEQNPGLPESEINNHIGNLAYNMMDKSYTNNIARYTTDISQLDRQLKDIESKGHIDKDGNLKPTEQQYPAWLQLRKMKEDYNGYLSNMNNQYLTFQQGKDRKIQEYTQDPQEAFAAQEKDSMVSNWATGVAAHIEEDIKPNSAYSDAQRLQHDYYATNELANYHRGELAIRGTETAEKAANEGLIWNPDKGVYERGADWYLKNISGNSGDSNISLQQSALLGTPQADNINPLEVPHAYDNYINNQVIQPAKDANDILFSVSGAAGTLEGTPITMGGKSDTLSIRDIDIAHEAIQKKYSDPKYTYNPQEILSVGKLAAAVGSKEIDPISLKTALETKLGHAERNKDGSPDMMSLQRANILAQAEDKLQQSIANEKRMKEQINNQILSNPQQNRDIIVGDHIVGINDLVPLVSQLHLHDENGKEIDPKDIATAWMTPGGVRASATQNGQTLLSIGKNNYVLPYKFDQFSKNEPQDIYNNIVQRFGDPDTFAEKLKNAQNKVLNSLPANEVATGLRGFGSVYNDVNPTQIPMKNAISLALSNPANTLPDGNMSDKEVANVRQLLSDPHNNIQQVEPVPYGGKGGGPSVNVTFKGKTDENGNPTKAHVPITMNVDPNTKDKSLQFNLQYSGNSEYGDMMKGRIYEANDVQKIHGYKPTITPIGKDASGRYTGVAISGTYGYIDPNTGKMIQKNIGQHMFSFSSQTPKQIMDEVNKEFINTIQQNINNFEWYRKKNPNTPTFDQLEKQFQ